ncbi:MAG TPA: D-tyrosyl-tRNA(Tyr) deacylase [Myxococcales bacterium]|nr:D-tyrosyl-tRNA(Tyr) deacylase [Myxococcales bacterium]
MRAVVQRVLKASVRVQGHVVGQIAHGLMVLVSVGQDDTDADIDLMTKKLSKLRVFTDAEGKMNLDVLDAGGSLLLVSQFTLHGDVRKGRRPSFVRSMRPERAEPMLNQLAEALRSEGLAVEIGRFGANMQVSLINDGPVTILIDTKKVF